MGKPKLVRIYPRRELRDAGGYVPGVPDDGADLPADEAQGFIDAEAATTDGPPYPVDPPATTDAPADPADKEPV